MLSPKQTGTLVLQTVKEFGADNCTQMAAAISYYVLFSLFPLLIFSVGILGVFLQDSAIEEELISLVLENLPLNEDEGEGDVRDAIQGIAGVSSGALGLVGLLGMAWSGSNMFGIIRRSLNIAYDLDLQRPLVRQKLLDLGMVFMFTPFFLSSIAATALFRAARRYSSEIPTVGGWIESLGFGWDILGALVPIAMSFIAFLVLFWIVPATKVKISDAWVGALVSALLFELSKVGFSIYLEKFGNYDVVFGSLGAVVILMFWIFISANILLLGAEVASEYPRVKRGDYDKPPQEPKPSVPLRDKAFHLLKGLVIQPPKDDPPPE